MKARRGFTIMEIMVVVAIIIVLTIIAIPNLLNARKSANAASARAGLQIISTALETYAAAHNGQFPDAESDLLGASPPYLNDPDPATADTAYDDQVIQGYAYTYFTLTSSAYCIQAAPSSSTTGDTTYHVETGGALNEGACS